MDKVVHFEIPADDVARAKEFYASAFGWSTQDYDMGGGTYTIVQTVPVDERQMPTEPGAINGGLMRRSPDTPHPVITIQVDAIDEALNRIEAGGGRVVTPRTEVPNMGWFAYFQDPEGNTLGLWETAV
ncbi:MAG TPA: VOC family protein [Actinomycetota bacterium]|nr:VOC family protein [Actinomycetota bacterium]